jgi:hypothetical protein
MTLLDSEKQLCLEREVVINLESEEFNVSHNNTKLMQTFLDKISNYSFILTTMCMMLVYSILGTLRSVQENISIAKAVSVPTLFISITWHF